jgi:hypothetical protein
MHRGKQYVRAIQLYYKKFNAYPPTLDALVKTNDIRFLRKKYIDPTTGKVDWKPILFCQNKTPMAMGFFGQPLGPPGCGPGAGTGPGGMPGNSLQGGIGANGGSSIFPSSPTGGSSIFSSSPTGNSPAEPGAGAGAAPGTGSTDQSGNGSSGQPVDANGTPLQGQTFGGGGIVGVSPASPKQSIYVFKKKNHYNEWEFLYSPLQDMQTITGGNTNIGAPAGGIGQPGIGQPGMGQPGAGQPGFGPGGNTGSSPIAPTPQPAPNPQ